jgi:hypothetical protein
MAGQLDGLVASAVGFTSRPETLMEDLSFRTRTDVAEEHQGGSPPVHLPSVLVLVVERVTDPQ